MSFDLIIYSFRGEWSSLLAFGDCGANCGYYVDAIFLNNKLMEIQYLNSASEKFIKIELKIELNHWYNIIIEQNYVNRYKYFNLTIDGKLIHSIEISNPKTFNNVKVFAGVDTHPPSIANYKNLVWENLPLPDILFNEYTPAIVSLVNKITMIISKI